MLFFVSKRTKFASACFGIFSVGALYSYVNNKRRDYLNRDFYSFCTIRDIRQISPSTNIYELEFDRPSKQYQNCPIQNVLLKNSDIQIQRYYTPIYISPTKVVLLVKFYEDGEVSRWIHRKRVGDRIELRGPFLEWQWNDNKWKNVLFIAGGTGITPAYQLLSYIFQDGIQFMPKFHLIYANRNPDEILLKKELDSLQEKYSENLKITYFVDSSLDNKILDNYLIRSINLHDIIQAFPSSSCTDSDTIVLVCGTDGFVSYIAGPKDTVYGEQGNLGGLLKKAKCLNVWKL
ncbi:hypothetical protein T552_02699 [Pneumocystis carinii B80]|uniref:NADH-cytochrome b5 reductase n=1 Tax=Pneumocystis carinii (strain B80) TaxID=1408658 RepID=A0A0W4ZE91_PNEC8|nr:hypothetical protein T552_02699 [Pneumocystis carinii B80]KTW26692.1 hypothetical protein T552_02699 [Pneumocystis carinii B80]